MTQQHSRNHHPSFPLAHFLIASLSGGICGYLLVSDRVPDFLFRAAAWVDLYLFTVLAFWCVWEWVFPRLCTLWHELHACMREQAEQNALSRLIVECVNEARREHQGHDTCYLLVQDDEDNLYALSSADSGYREIAQVLIRAAETCSPSVPTSDEYMYEHPEDRSCEHFAAVIGGLGKRITVRDWDGHLRVLVPGDAGYEEAARLIVAHQPHLAPLFQETDEDDPASEKQAGDEGGSD